MADRRCSNLARLSKLIGLTPKAKSSSQRGSEYPKAQQCNRPWFGHLSRLDYSAIRKIVPRVKCRLANGGVVTLAEQKHVEAIVQAGLWIGGNTAAIKIL